jgi:hypothetical protein
MLVLSIMRYSAGSASIGAITLYNLSHVDVSPLNAAQEALRLLAPFLRAAYLGKVRPTGNASQGRPFLFTHSCPNQPAEGGYEDMRYQGTVTFA